MYYMQIKYKIIIQWSDTDNCYVANIPELPGCMADGKTLAEVTNNIQTVHDEWIETAKQLGRDIPQPEVDPYIDEMVSTIAEEKEDDAFCQQLYQNYLNSSDKDKETISLEQLAKELNINIDEVEPLPDEVEIIAKTNEDIKKNGVVPHDDIDWD